jgi:hypothetical protein
VAATDATLSAAPERTAGLGPRGRRIRVACGVAVIALLLAGTAFGQDDDFPFGPFRMYSTTQRLDGATSWYRIEGVTDEGEVIGIPISRFGVRRAEVEGQLNRIEADPSLLGSLETAYERRQPSRRPLVEIHLIRHDQPLRGGQPFGQATEEVVATWQR